ncbi:hypothetical protein BMJ29_22030 [Sinorhizobium medicae]|nr:hypothetical protein BMJ29_22030 [Sinorhizobium medicae]PLU79755.1 hypothetical protein BMJ19_11720 [Sinorhizobium medicae]
MPRCWRSATFAVLFLISRRLDFSRLHKAALDGKPTAIVEEHEGSRLFQRLRTIGFRSGLKSVDPLFDVRQLRLRLVVGHAAFNQLGKLVIFCPCGIKRRLIFFGKRKSLWIVALHCMITGRGRGGALDPFPAFCPNGSGGRLELFCDELFDQRGVHR